MQCKEQLLKTKFTKMHNKIKWDDDQYFLKLALLGILKGVAKALGVNHSSVFRRINSLEDKMDLRLFEMLEIDLKLLGKYIRLSGTIKKFSLIISLIV
jgi:hypothetical protein